MAGIKQLNQQVETKTRNRTSNQDKWLLKMFDDTLGYQQNSSRVGVFYPSMLGNECDRYLYLAFRGLLPQQVIASVTQRIFDTGSSLEDRMTKYFEKMQILRGREIAVKCDSPPISGRADFLLAHEEHSEIVLELKSINDKGFKNLYSKPKPEHAIQLQIYLQLMDKPYGIVLYENKNDQKLKAFKVKRSPKEWNFLVTRCKQIQEAVEIPSQCTGPSWCACRKYKEDEDGREVDTDESVGESE
ncbi:MAG: hypothetical protein CMI54_02110 [Parcubacteria group bacterium]|nr:hypothetical protein [Parcubacteria group bacterium]